MATRLFLSPAAGLKTSTVAAPRLDLFLKYQVHDHAPRHWSGLDGSGYALALLDVGELVAEAAEGAEECRVVAVFDE